MNLPVAALLAFAVFAAEAAGAASPRGLATRLAPWALSAREVPPSPTGVRVLGVPGPGVTPAHLEAVKALVERAGTAVVIDGSRQTGLSRHTGLPFAADADLNLGVVAPASNLLKIDQDLWDGRVPHARRPPTLSAATIEEAVGRGLLVVTPEPAPLPGGAGELQRLARPWSTAEQLAKLASAPRVAAAGFRFAVIGDAEPGRFWIARKFFNTPGVFGRLLARADRAGADFIVQLGDMVSRGTASKFRAFIGGLASARVRTPYLTVLGNHDRHAPHRLTNDRMYRAAFGSPDYSFTRGGWRFVVVDSSAGRLSRAQLRWLAGRLDAAVPTVVFTHMPPAPLSEWTDWGALKGAGGFKEGSAEFMRLMSDHKVARVYMGHIHGLGLMVRDGVTYVLSGGGGSPLFPGPVKERLHHWLSVEAGPGGLVETVHADDGSTFRLL